MRTITDSVLALLQNDEVAREAARRGILNSSAYAREIRPQIEENTWKDLEETSVSVAINRIAQKAQWTPIKPELQFDKVTVETGLVDVTFERTLELQQILNTVIPDIRRELPQDLYIESTGQHQITIIMTSQFWSRLSSQITQQPIGIYTNQVALSVSFDRKYLEVPNFIYSVLSIFALRNINLIEIVSTMTEIILVIDSTELESAMGGLKPYLR